MDGWNSHVKARYSCEELREVERAIEHAEKAGARNINVIEPKMGGGLEVCAEIPKRRTPQVQSTKPPSEKDREIALLENRRVFIEARLAELKKSAR